MPRCSALNCKNRGTHLFPKDPKRRKSWENALRIENFKASPTAQLCRDHFEQDDYFGKSAYTDAEPIVKRLKKSAVPSIFYFTKIQLEAPETLESQQEYETRTQAELLQDNVVTKEHIGCPFIPYVGLDEEIYTTACIDESTDPLEPHKCAHRDPECLTKSTQVDFEHVYGSIKRFMSDDKSILFYTGFKTYKEFHFVFSTLSPMAQKMRYFDSKVIFPPIEDQFLLTMMKLRQNKCNLELSRFYNISETTVSKIFITWINYMYQLWSTLKIWPTRDLIQSYMPQHFKEYDKNISVILDGTEITITVQTPKSPISQQATCGSYKHSNTLKMLVGATPGGLPSYCSQAYAGSVSDRQTVERSDLVSKCQRGDTVLADRGFTVQDMFANKKVTVKTPALLKGESQLPGPTVIKDRELASKRVHIERMIGLTKTYKILKSELDLSYMPIASKIFFVCFMCCNIRECIMKKNK